MRVRRRLGEIAEGTNHRGGIKQYGLLDEDNETGGIMAGFKVAPPGRAFVQQLRKTLIFRSKDFLKILRFLDTTSSKLTVWKRHPLSGTFPA